MLKYLLVLLALSPCCSVLKAQKIVINNVITQQPVEMVYILQYHSGEEAITDSLGIADITNFSKKDTLVFHRTGYITVYHTKTQIVASGNVVEMEDTVYGLPPFNFEVPRDQQSPEDIAIKMVHINKSDIFNSMAPTGPEMLRSVGNVAVQQSQMGGGSPIIRGMEANRVLLVVDGVRMNNAIYRSGHLQNALTVDNFILDGVDVFYGPGSVIYGSDALGGVIHYHTISPDFSNADTTIHNSSFYSRFSSANSEKTAHFDFSLGKKKVAWFSSATISDFGDLTMGKNRKHGYADWGKILNYAERIDDRDTMISNPFPEKQIHTAYRQLDLFEKVRFKLNEHVNFAVNLQFSTSTNIPRFDKLNDYKNDTLKYAEWNYGPQQRFLASLKSEVKLNRRFLDIADFIVAFQKIDEDRFTRKFGSTDRFLDYEDVYVTSFNADLLKVISSKEKLYYGVEVVTNQVQSLARMENIITGYKPAAPTRYPHGGSNYSTFAIYAGYDRPLGLNSIIMLGTRYSYTVAKSIFDDTTFYQLPTTEMTINNGALSGSAGYAWTPDTTAKIRIALTTGFRNPNVDDYGKIFEKNGMVVVPNENLKPEYSYNAELGIMKGIVKNKLQLHVTGFFTYLSNAIVKRDYSLNGSDSILYEGDWGRIQTNMNAARAEIYGANATVLVHLPLGVLVSASYNYTVGKVLSDSVPLAHIPPFYGQIAVKFQVWRLKNNFYVQYSGAKKLADYSPGTEDNLSEATIDGLPSWMTFNYSFHLQAMDGLYFQAGINNILDYHYKTFASGISAPGRNVIVGLKAIF